MGCDVDSVIDFVRSNELLIHVRDPRPKIVSELRKKAEAMGLGLRRLAVEEGSRETLPYADNLVDVVIAQAAVPTGLPSIGCTGSP